MTTKASSVLFTQTQSHKSSKTTQDMDALPEQMQAGPSTGVPDPALSMEGNVKQKRRRQRLSCVECTIRRQKCDRQTPCGLCTSRGIPHLCHWEPVVTRPAPQRPPTQGQLVPQAPQNTTIETLLARVAALEAALRLKESKALPAANEISLTEATEPPLHPSPSSSTNCDAADPLDHPRETITSTESAGSSIVPLIDSNVQAAVVVFSQLSLAPRTEYIGLRTATYTLHHLGNPAAFRVPYSRTSTMRTKEPNEHSVITPTRRLITQLPSRQEVDNLLTIFFSTRNSEFGISEIWVRSSTHSMWAHMDRRCSPDCLEKGGCPGCREEANSHWLSLLFAIFSITPVEDGSQLRATAFNNALAARRLFEDTILGSPAAVSDASLTGSVISCLAAVMMATYLADHGRVSEAWKMIGSTMRCGQALGLHRDARWEMWEPMAPLEVELRSVTWWLLVVADREYSFVLGRPVMSKLGSFETSLLPIPSRGDGTPNPHTSYQSLIVKLSDLICDAITKCFGWEMPSYATIQSLDRRYQEWEKQLPSRFKWRTDTNSLDDDGPPTSRRLFAYQKVILSVWWLETLMVIHRIYLMHPPCIVPPPGVINPRIYNPSREKCIELAIELTHVLLHFLDESSHWPVKERVCPTFFHYFLFDSAIALAGALSQNPPHPKATECLDLLKRSMEVLEKAALVAETAVDGEGETAKRSIKVLRALMRAGGWEGTPVPFDDAPRNAPPRRGIPEPEETPPVAEPFYPEPQRSRQLSQMNSGRPPHRPSSSRNSAHRSSLQPPPPTIPDNMPPQHNLEMLQPSSYATRPPLYEGAYTGPSTDIGSTVPPGFFANPVQTYNSMGFCPPRSAAPSTTASSDRLQWVHPSQPIDFGLDWERLVGSNNWYGGGGNGAGTSGTHGR